MNTKRFSNFGATAGFFAALAAVLAVLFLAACEPEKQTAARSSASLEQEPVRWSQATSAAAFSKRSEHASLAFDGKLWVIGGKENRSAVTNNIWSSDDGVTWNQVAQKVIDASRFASRANFPAVVFKNKMWVLGGDTYYDIWSSSNGAAWNQETYASFLSNRYYPSVVVFNNKLWALGTSDDKVWSSDDGVTWTEVLAGQGTRFSGRNGVGSVVFDNRLWVIGGFENGSFNYKNDVWSSDDGANWTLETGAAGFSARRPYGNVVVFAGKIWVIGGQVSNGFINDVWSSSDGKTWTQAADAPFSARSGHRVVVFGNGIWVIGGNSNGTYQNDVWQYGQ